MYVLFQFLQIASLKFKPTIKHTGRNITGANHTLIDQHINFNAFVSSSLSALVNEAIDTHNNVTHFARDVVLLLQNLKKVVTS